MAVREDSSALETMMPLAGLRVLEVGHQPGAAEGARLLGLLGAHVARVRCSPWHGDRRHDGGDGQRPFCTPDEARRTTWDLAIIAEPLVVPNDVELADHARSVVQVTADVGPADSRWYEAELAAAGGLAGISGEPGGPALWPPAGVVAGLVGGQVALAGLAALGLAERGQPSAGVVRVSSLRAALAAVSPLLAAAAYSGQAPPRPGNRSQGLTPGSVLPCADGFLGVGVANDEDWEAFGRLCDHPGLADRRFATASGRRTHAGRIADLLRPWLHGHSRAELFELAQSWRLPFAPALAPWELARDPHVLTRRALVTGSGAEGRPRLSPASPFRFTPTVAAQVGATRPLPGVEFVTQMPLAGIRVLDLSALWAGPYAGRLLAALGAQVIKVEAPQRPDGTRGSERPEPDESYLYPGGEAGRRPRDRCARFNDLNRGKLGITLNLATPDGKAIFRRLLARADVVLESFSPRVMPNFGLAPQHLLEQCPWLVWVSLPAFGLDGPYRDYVALGGGLELLSGLAVLAGSSYGDGRPHLLGTPVTDCLAGVHAALGALAGLRWRARHGAGGHVEVAQFQSALQLVGNALGAPPDHRPECPLPAGRARSLADLLDDRELGEAFQAIAHPVAGVHRYLREPWHLGRAPRPVDSPAPTFGQHTAAVLRDLAGVGEAERDRLAPEGVIAAGTTTDG